MSSVLRSAQGFGGRYPTRFAQVGDKIVCTNGWDIPWVFNVRTGTDYDLGLAAPAAAPTGALAAGAMTGTFRYRVRFTDADKGTISLPSPELSKTQAAQQVTITRPALPGGGRQATHWLLEATTDGGDVFFPVNDDLNGGYGTPIATTTFVMNISNLTLLTYKHTLPENQYQPASSFPLICSANGYIFMAGALVHSATAGFTNGSTAVTGLTGLTSRLNGLQVVAAGTADLYTFTVTGATTGTLDRNFLGTTANHTISIFDKGNAAIFSEVDALGPSVESYGSIKDGNATGNKFLVGDSRRVLALAGLAYPGGMSQVLFCKRNVTHAYSFLSSPHEQDGGRLIQLPDERGALGARSVKVVDGRAYGIDEKGVWRYAPGGRQEEIGQAIAGDWKRGNLNFAAGEAFWIGHDPKSRKLYFWFVSYNVGGAIPNQCYVWDLAAERWIGTQVYFNSRSAGCALPDAESMLRMHSYNVASSAASACCWAHGIGKSDGASPVVFWSETFAPRVMPVTVIETSDGASYTTITVRGAYAGGTTYARGDQVTSGGKTWISLQNANTGHAPGSNPTWWLVRCGASATLTYGAHAISGIPVTLIRAADGSMETQLLEDLDSATVVVSTWAGAYPVVGDTFVFGAIPWRVRSGRLGGKMAWVKQTWQRLSVRPKSKTGAAVFSMKFWIDGKAQSGTPVLRPNVFSQDGVSHLAGADHADIDPTAGNPDLQKFPISLLDTTGFDMQFELYSRADAGVPTEILIPIVVECSGGDRDAR